MSGEKLVTAKRAALAVLDRLEERDRIAVVVFDDRIDVVQPAALASAETKERIRAQLARSARPMDPLAAKEAYFQAQRRSRGQKDFRRA